jgi:serine phosphatase RsbU (regulator of sigma subunit)/PAS domain-containing protein
VTVPGGGGEFRRLSALVARQRGDLDRMQAQAASRSLVDLARGMLMAQLGCSPAGAAEQLARLSQDANTSVAELAAQITGQLQVTGQTQITVQPLPGAADGAGSGGERAAGDGAADEESAAGLARAGAAAEVTQDGDEIAAALLEEALAPVGAAAVALWAAEPDGGLELAGAAGFGPREASRWRRVHPDMGTAAQRAARDGLESWWPSGRPDGAAAAAIGHWPAGARAVLPLPGSMAALGAIEICWPEPLEEFPDSLRRLLASLADVCAQTLGVRLRRGDMAADRRASWAFGLLDALPGSALFADAVRDGCGTVTDLRIRYLSDEFSDPAGRARADLAGRPLLEVYPAAALPGGLFDIAAGVLATGAPRNISGAVISTPVGDGIEAPVLGIRVAPLYDGVVIAWRHADEVERLTALLQQAERLGRIGGWEENLLTGEVLWTEAALALFGRSPGAPVPIAGLDAHVHADDRAAAAGFRAALLTEGREAAAAFRVIRSDDQSIRQMRAFAEPVTDAAGHLVAVRGAYQDVSADYHTQVAFAATRDRLADTEEWAEEEHRLALRLQQAITPRTAVPVPTPGLDVAARYRPAGPGSLVSGDWYDTVPLPSGQIFIAVGDIAGHGIDAVTGMVALRNCLRGLAITGAGPAELLDWLNKIAFHLTDGIIGTAVCGLFDPETRSLRWARAGHLPPVLVRDGKAAILDLPDGVLLGADPDAVYREAALMLEPGDALVLYTDGLIERHDEPIDDSLDGLLALATAAAPDIHEFADHLLSEARSDTSDDACLVAVRVR